MENKFCRVVRMGIEPIDRKEKQRKKTKKTLMKGLNTM